MTHFQFALEQKRNECIAQLQAGVALCQLAKIMKVSDASLRKKIKQWDMNHLLKPITENNGAAKVRQIMIENKDKILDLRNNGAGINRLGKMFRVSNSVIYKYLAIWESHSNCKHGLMTATYDRYIPALITDADFEREIKTAVYKNTKHGVSNCFPINSNCERKIID